MIEITSKVIEEYIDSLPDSDYSVITKNMLDKILSMQNSDSIEGIVNRTLQGYFILSGALQAIIIENEQIIYQFGLSLIQPDKLIDYYSLLEKDKTKEHIYHSTTSVNGLPFDLYYCFPKKNSAIMFIVPTEYKIEEKSIEPIYSIMNHYFHYSYNQSSRDTYLLFSEFIQSLKNGISVLKEKNYNSIILTRLRYQDLKPYYSTIGLDNTKYILSFLEDEIKKRLDTDDLFFQISQRDVFILSASSSIESNKKKFGDLYFQYKYIIINYKMYHHFFDLSEELDESFLSKVFQDGL